jgi:hypothetical protein
MFRMEIANQKPIILDSWSDVENHPLFPVADVFTRVSFGWMAI